MNPDRAFLFVTRKWPPAVGGMEIYAREMAQELQSLGRTTVLALPGRADGRPPHSGALLVFLLRSLWHLLRRGGRYDIVLLGDLVLAPLAMPLWLFHRSSRVGVALHGTDVAYPIRNGALPWLYRQYLRLIALGQGTIATFVANSTATARHARNFGLAKVEVVPLGVRLPPAPASAAPGRYILFVGRITPRKGAAWFAENVLAALPADIRLKVAGTSWDSTEVARLAANGRVDLLGPVFGNDLQRLRAEALAVVVPNIPLGGRDFEGFGLVALEAAADGGVVLAADLDGISSAVVHGVTGFLVPPEDTHAWVESVYRILDWQETERQRFIANARGHLANQFTWAGVAHRTIVAIEGNSVEAKATTVPA